MADDGSSVGTRTARPTTSTTKTWRCGSGQLRRQPPITATRPPHALAVWPVVLTTSRSRDFQSDSSSVASAFATSAGDRLPPRSRPRLLLRLAAEDSIDSPPRGAPARRENENTMGDGSAHPPLISQCVSLH